MKLFGVNFSSSSIVVLAIFASGDFSNFFFIINWIGFFSWLIHKIDILCLPVIWRFFFHRQSISFSNKLFHFFWLNWARMFLIKSENPLACGDCTTWKSVGRHTVQTLENKIWNIPTTEKCTNLKHSWIISIRIQVSRCADNIVVM